MSDSLQHNKVLRDNIEAISNPALQRLAFKAGVKSLCLDSYSGLRKILYDYLLTVVSRSLVFMQTSSQRTLSEQDVRNGLKTLGRTPVFADGSQVMRKTQVIVDSTKKAVRRTVKNYSKTQTKACRVYHGSSVGRHHVGGGGGPDLDDEEELSDSDNEDDFDPNDNEATAEENEENYKTEVTGGAYKKHSYALGGVKKPHRWRPGTVALRKIRYYQKQSGRCYSIAFLSFSRLAREVAQMTATDVRFSKGALMVLQLDAENYLINLLQDANKIALHCKHIRVSPEDIILAQQIGHSTGQTN